MSPENALEPINREKMPTLALTESNSKTGGGSVLLGGQVMSNPLMLTPDKCHKETSLIETEGTPCVLGLSVTAVRIIVLSAKSLRTSVGNVQ